VAAGSRFQAIQDFSTVRGLAAKSFSANFSFVTELSKCGIFNTIPAFRYRLQNAYSEDIFYVSSLFFQRTTTPAF
jgi:hypothetical protein